MYGENLQRTELPVSVELAGSEAAGDGDAGFSAGGDGAAYGNAGILGGLPLVVLVAVVPQAVLMP